MNKHIGIFNKPLSEHRIGVFPFFVKLCVIFLQNGLKTYYIIYIY